MILLDFEKYSRAMSLIIVIGIMLMVIGAITRSFFSDIQIIYIMLAGYGLYLIGVTIWGIFGEGGSGSIGSGCCFSGFLSIFPMFFLPMFAPYPLGMGIISNHWQLGSLGYGLIIFAVFYVFFGIIISIIRNPKSTKVASANIEHSQISLHQEKVIEREKLLVRRIPPQCFKCGADINPEEVDWIGPDTVRCPHCGASLVVQFERV